MPTTAVVSPSPTATLYKDRFTGMRIAGALVFVGLLLSIGIGCVHAQTPLLDFKIPKSQGSNPNSLIQAQDGYFYGTTATGGSTLGSKVCLDYNGNDVGCGTVFRMDEKGNITPLKSFLGTDGAYPNGLIQFHDGALYGTTAFGGASLNQPYDTGAGTQTPSCVNPATSLEVGMNFLNIGCGTIFRITTAGVFTSLYSFPGAVDSNHPSGGAVNGTEEGSFPNPLIVGARVMNGVPTEVMFGTTLACNGLLSEGGVYSDPLGRPACSYSTGTLFQYSPPASLSAPATAPILLHTFLPTFPGSYPNSLVQGSDGSLYGSANGYADPESPDGAAVNGACANIGLFDGESCGVVFQYAFPTGPDTIESATEACNFACVANQTPSCSAATSSHAAPRTPKSNLVIRQPGRGYPITQWPLSDYPMALTEGADGNYYGVSAPQIGAIDLPSTAFQCIPHTNPKQSNLFFPTGTFNILYTFADPALATGTSTTGLTLGGDDNFYGVSVENVFDIPASVAASYISNPMTAPLSALTQYGGFSLSAYPDYSFNSLIQGGDSNFYATASSSSTTDGGAVFKFAGPEYPVYLYPEPNQITLGQPFNLEWEVSNAHSLTAQQCNVIAQNSSSTAGTWTIPVANASDRRFNPFSSVSITPTAVGTYTYAMTCGGTESGFTTVTVTPPPPATAPVFSLAAGTYHSAQTLAISDTTPGAAIYYTFNGTAPTTASTKYTAPVTINSGVTVHAVAEAPNYALSGETSAAYAFAASVPVLKPAAGEYSGPLSVTITSATPTAKIFYTVNGATPTASATAYTGPITVSKSETIRAVTAETGYSQSAVVTSAYTIAPLTAAPVLSLAPGTYNKPQTLTIDDSTSGASIYFTLNGTTPTAASTKYTGAITINSATTVEAVALSPGDLLSGVSSATYSFTAATPIVSPQAGQYGAPVAVTIASATPAGKIYYTTNGTTPSASSTLYTGPITVSATATIKALTAYAGYTSSAVATAAYTIVPSVATATPTLSLASGTYHSAQSLTIANTTPGAVIYYTLNGTAPTTSSTRYMAPVSINSSLTVQALALAPGYLPSDASTATYVFSASTPALTPNTGSYSGPLTVTMSSATPTAKIFYTTNGNTPTASATLYTGPITVSASETVKAIAAETGYTPSAVASATYTLMPATAGP